MTSERNVPELLAENERLKSQLDELIKSVYEHCNAFSPPFCKAETLEVSLYNEEAKRKFRFNADRWNGLGN